MDKLAAWSPNLLALLVIALAGLGSSVATSRLARWRDARWLDRPNHRSLHERPTPRNGGLAIVGSILIGVLALSGIGGYHPNMGLLLLGVTPVTAVALLDDLTDLSVRARLLAQLVAAALLLLSLEALPPLTLPGMVPASPSAVPAPGVTALTGPVAWLGLYLFVIWMTNLYNFMDGMDGFAAGMTVYGFGTLALLGGLAGQAQFVLWCTLLCAAAGGFLRHNFPPARIFMGDVGSATIGFLVAGTLLWAAAAGICPLWLGIVVFSPFIVDASLTLLQRALRGERIWEAHRSHYYQRLARCGWGHRKTVLWEYALMTLCALAAVACVLVRGRPVAAGVELGVVGMMVLVYVALALYVRRIAPARALREPPAGLSESRDA